MRVAIPHQLEREEVRRRLRDNSHKIADNIPGGVVTTEWPSTDRMTMATGLERDRDVGIERQVLSIDLVTVQTVESAIVLGGLATLAVVLRPRAPSEETQEAST